MATKRKQLKATPYLEYLRILDAISKPRTEEEIMQAAAFMITATILKYPFEERLSCFEEIVRIIANKIGMYEKAEEENGKAGRTQKREAGNGRKSEA